MQAEGDVGIRGCSTYRIAGRVSVCRVARAFSFFLLPASSLLVVALLRVSVGSSMVWWQALDLFGWCLRQSRR